ncbi:MAG: DEAD/DEAH box helicase [Deltaproteobacteria bacterium]|nr:DEAD/DEAH box helicase [Deltaproteobacteria bacterium]
MPENHAFDAVPCGLGKALKAKGFSHLTAIQESVLDPAIAGRDLRLSSKTGSGKTVAIGLVVADKLGALAPRPKHRQPIARPRALVVAPTRELAAQLGRELSWLFASLGARLTVVTGGTNMGGDFRALAGSPHVVVGTPGRLGDHLRRGSLDLSAAEVVVLDEADEMLDMGFRDELEAILDQTPDGRDTHLVSATFPREVLKLANRYQRDAVMVQGSPAGSPNQDIKHIGHVVADRDKLSALVNVLLANDASRALVFVRTRIGTTELATELGKLGFTGAPLSGEMSQRERTATLESFRSGTTRVLAATDVAARGLDIEDVALVVHYDLPENAEVLTHRSGRTGRAGNKGTSIALVTPRERRRAEGMSRRVGIELHWHSVPSPDFIRRSGEHRLVAELASGETATDESRALARKLLAAGDPETLVALLLERADHKGPCEPREVREPKPGKPGKRPAKPHRGGRPPQRGQRGDYQRFYVNWGAKHGATKPRLLAMVCRRGDIGGKDVGAIRVTEFSTVVEVASQVADKFHQAAERPDPRNPRVKIRPWRDD